MGGVHSEGGCISPRDSRCGSVETCRNAEHPIYPPPLGDREEPPHENGTVLFDRFYSSVLL